MLNRHHSRTFGTVFALCSVTAFGALAQSPLALQVTPRPEQSPTVVLSLEALDAMDQVSFSTTTIWTDGLIDFSGVSLKALLEELEATGDTVEMVALNDYAVTIPRDELEDDAPIIATRMNGEEMTVRNKGPFWIVFPFDADDKYKTEIHYARSIWQLNRLNMIE